MPWTLGDYCSLLLALFYLSYNFNCSNLVIGNGLMNYDFNAGNGTPNYDLFVEMLDGFCMEHMMVFEAAISDALEPPFIRVTALENLIQLRERLVQAGKYLLVRAYPGPLGNPVFISSRIVHLPDDAADMSLSVFQVVKQCSPAVGC